MMMMMMMMIIIIIIEVISLNEVIPRVFNG
jgi:hypothetical protein